MVLRICLAGATGHVGRELATAILAAKDLELRAAVGRRHAGRALGEVIGDPGAKLKISATVAEALAGSSCQVLIDYTRPEAVKENVRTAIAAGCHAVIG
ncbi:MAG TPA: 4-hydroxy-tetrahydrodipicolinate reductase, partial [Gammaproteobacteria bacterium]|nr:4-hydroxy-tetrahydrodipicolinate reductase [Gammaproteobacteria bacterium]